MHKNYQGLKLVIMKIKKLKFIVQITVNALNKTFNFD
jgi:hypothetical protein